MATLVALVAPLTTVHGASPLSLAVSGNHLVDGNGQTIRLLGVDRSGTEYACIQGWGIFDGPNDAASVAAIASWHTNAVRVPLNEDCWLNINMGTSTYGGAGYQSAIINYVNLLHQNGLYAILDLHWTAPGTQQATGQMEMADADHAPTFWSSIATAFKNDPAVVFDLYNEPHDISWSCWLNGCAAGSPSFQTAGMQSLVNAVRSTGATQPIMAGGLAWSNDLSQWLANKPTDAASSLTASWHVYNFNTCSTTSCWNTTAQPVAASVPVIAGELGENDCAHGFIDGFMSWADAAGISYLGWTWNTGSCTGWPSLIASYDGTPSAFGIGLRDHLAAIVPPPPGPTGGSYHPLTPARILDTRTAGGRLNDGSVRKLVVVGAGGIPGTGVQAVVLNVTATGTTAPSYLTVYPEGAARPLASNLNWTAGETVANLVEVKVGAAGAVDLYNAAGSVQAIVDVEGWVGTPTPTPSPAGLYKPIVSARALDTRNGNGGYTTPVGPGGTISVSMPGRGGLPASGMEAVVLNVTVTNPTAGSYLTVYPTGETRPLASNLNFTAGQTRANRVVVPLGTSGSVSFYNAAGSVDVIADVGGWFTDSTPGGTGSVFTGLPPARILDTRLGQGPIGPGGTPSVAVAGHAGVPNMGAATPPTAVVLNVTVTNPTAPSYLTVWPEGAGRPFASDLNYTAGQTVPNLVVVQIGADGNLSIYNAAGSTDVVIDVVGYYS